ncbi:unnamed protein product [Psylliodes chrysocephalus]|uniref:Uncharacterized protein n=1 Tax=Psylliodes chrysocephalus TaxID=3402493 RepID=A0A9P0CJ51_9CUCU|nr:unnamed protein product [Psylliodes chrysocephala]
MAVKLKEADDEMRRVKNILICGIAEAQGDSAVKKKQDKEKLDLILSSLGSTAEMVSFYRIEKPNSNNKYPRMIKVTFQCQSDAKFILRLKRKLMENNLTKDFSITDDKTQAQNSYLNELRTELENKNRNGTDKYINGSPKIVHKF